MPKSRPIPSASRMDRITPAVPSIPENCRNLATLMAVRHTTPPTLISMPPPIITIVSEHPRIIRYALLFSRLKISCRVRNRFPRKIIAAAYIVTKIPIAMSISSFVFDMGCRRTVPTSGFFAVISLTSPPLLFWSRNESFSRKQKFSL